MTPITGILAIIDRLIMLLEKRSSRRRQVFVDFVEPIFLDLTTVHEDYRNAFSETFQLLSDSSLSSLEIAEKLIDRKRQLESIRQKLNELLRELNKSNTINRSWLPSEVREFCEIVASYFRAGAGLGPLHLKSGITWYCALLDIIQSVGASDDYNRPSLLEKVKEMNQNIDIAWGNVTVAYARARVFCLKS